MIAPGEKHMNTHKALLTKSMRRKLQLNELVKQQAGTRQSMDCMYYHSGDQMELTVC